MLLDAEWWCIRTVWMEVEMGSAGVMQCCGCGRVQLGGREGMENSKMYNFSSFIYVNNFMYFTRFCSALHMYTSIQYKSINIWMYIKWFIYVDSRWSCFVFLFVAGEGGKTLCMPSASKTPLCERKVQKFKWKKQQLEEMENKKWRKWEKNGRSWKGGKLFLFEIYIQ